MKQSAGPGLAGLSVEVSTIAAFGAVPVGACATMVGPTRIEVPAKISLIEQAIADSADRIITRPLDPTASRSVDDGARAKVGCVDPNANLSVGTA